MLNFDDLKNKAVSDFNENPKFDGIILKPDLKSLEHEFINGKPVGDDTRINELSDYFSWKRGFVNVFTGWPNHGKTTGTLFMMLNKSVHDGWKWVVWSPEMIGSEKKGKTIKINANDLIDDLVFAYTGKNPFKHYEEKYKLPRISWKEYKEAADFINEHFIFINLKERTTTELYDTLMYIYDTRGFDGFLLDPFKNLRPDSEGRTDQVLDATFSKFKELAIYTDTVFNIVAHPKSLREDQMFEANGQFKVCNQYHLLGGAAWDNNMDGIYSWFRPFKHKKATDPNVEFYNLKQRKQSQVGIVGCVDGIKYDWKTGRYYFKGVCPLDDQVSVRFREVKQTEQGEIVFNNSGQGEIAPF